MNIVTLHPNQDFDRILPGIYQVPVPPTIDYRGSLQEVFREDRDYVNKPVMAYLSWTLAGVTRGPHEHSYQSDFFCFPGPGAFRLSLWENRDLYSESKASDTRYDLFCGENYPFAISIPPGVVHGYKCLHSSYRNGGLVINLPDRLYRGFKKVEEVDEIRYENDSHCRFHILD